MNKLGAKKSKGHIAFFLFNQSSSWQEIYRHVDGDGSIVVAPVHNSIDVDGFRHGRWECYGGGLDSFLRVVNAQAQQWIDGP